MLDGVDVGLWVVKVWGNGRDELGAGGAEELLEHGERLGAASLQLLELVGVLLPQRRVDAVVQTGGVEGDADGDQGQHLVVLLGDGVVLRVLLEVLCPGDVDHDVVEHADGVGVAAHHHVRETHVVVGREVGGHDPGESRLLVELDVVERLEREAEVSEESVHPKQTDDGEIAQHAVQVLGAVFPGDGGGVLVSLHRRHLLRDLGSLDQRVQHVEHTVAAPRVGVLPQQSDFLLTVGVALASDSRSVRAERVELVDELIDDIPCPVVLRT